MILNQKVLNLNELITTTYSTKFTVLVFFRGNWCPLCEKYLQEYNEIVQDIKYNYGGAVVGVSAQSEAHCQSCIDQWGLLFPICSDPKNILAKQYQMTITKNPSNEFKSMKKTFTDKFPNDPRSEQLEGTDVYPHGISQPGVVIVRRKGDVVYKWKSSVTEKTVYGAYDRIDPEYIRDIVKFNFSQSATFNHSVKVGMLPCLFQICMSQESVKSVLYEHLKREGDSNGLQFLDSLDTVKMFQEEEEDISEYLQSLYRDFICHGAPQQICFPDSVYFPLYEKLGQEQSCNSLSIFDTAEFITRHTLRTEGFARFLMSPLIEQVVALVPFCFEAI
jgi:thiol-disulfide isomerase/thioredoxin